MQYVHQLKRWGVRKYNVETSDLPDTAMISRIDCGSNTNLVENRSIWETQQEVAKIKQTPHKISDPPWKAERMARLLDDRYAYNTPTAQECLLLKARCLSHCGYYKEAFPIYQAVWLNASESSHSFVHRYLILDELIHSATTCNDFDTIKSIDPCVYVSRQHIPGEIEDFLKRMLRLHLHKQSLDNLSRMDDVRLFHDVQYVNKLLSLLPQEDRRLDFAVYRNVTELVDYQFVLPGEELNRVQNLFLRQVPGPFELQGQVMRNPWIRSCLIWCSAQLLDLRLVSSDANHRMVIKHPSITALSAREIMDIAEILLYCSLLEKWGNQRKEFRTQILNSRVGLTAETILRKISSLIMDELSSNEANDDVRLSIKLQTSFSELVASAAISLLQIPDVQLARRFLDGFNSRNFRNRCPVNPHARNIVYKYVIAPLPMIKWIYMTENQQPSIQSEQSPNPDDGNKRLSRISLATNASSQTLARSLRSSDSSFAQMKKLRDVISESRSSFVSVQPRDYRALLDLVSQVSKDSISLFATPMDLEPLPQLNQQPNEQNLSEWQFTPHTRHTNWSLDTVGIQRVELETPHMDWVLDGVNEEDETEATQEYQEDMMNFF